MSYIRSGSSPECLYIYGARDAVYIHGGSNLNPIENPRFDHIVSYEDWLGLGKKYVNDECVEDENGLVTGEEFEFGNLHLEYKCVRPNEFRWVLTHKDGWSFEMWHVTWCHIATSFEG